MKQTRKYILIFTIILVMSLSAILAFKIFSWNFVEETIAISAEYKGETYYMERVASLPEGFGFILYKKNLSSSEKVAITSRIHDEKVLTYPNALLRFYKLDDELYRTPIFYYQVGTKGLLSSQEYTPSANDKKY